MHAMRLSWTQFACLLLGGAYSFARVFSHSRRNRRDKQEGATPNCQTDRAEPDSGSVERRAGESPVGRVHSEPTLAEAAALPPSCPDPVALASMPVLLITVSAYQAIIDYLTANDPERGGMMVGPKDSHLVTHFIKDDQADTTFVTYTPNASWLNEVLRKFVACGMDAKGMVHSHPPGCTRPSFGDIEHVRNTFARAKNSKAEVFFLPIVCGKRLYPYVFTREEPDRVQLAQVVLV